MVARRSNALFETDETELSKWNSQRINKAICSLVGGIKNIEKLNFWFLFQGSSRSVAQREEVQSVRPCASSLGKGHHELHATDEVHVQQHGNDRGQRRSTFRPGSQASQGHVICHPKQDQMLLALWAYSAVWTLLKSHQILSPNWATTCFRWSRKKSPWTRNNILNETRVNWMDFAQQRASSNPHFRDLNLLPNKYSHHISLSFKNQQVKLI